jgi:hypothetical protein
MVHGDQSVFWAVVLSPEIVKHAKGDSLMQ